MEKTMCGRYRLTQAERFAEMSEVRLAWNPKVRYNIAPTQSVPVPLDESLKELTELRWGLVPFCQGHEDWIELALTADASRVGAEC